MKPVKYTIAVVTQMAAQHPSPSKFKKANASAYKAMRKYGLHEVLYPKENRERHQEFTEAELIDIMRSCESRSDFQRKHASAYNAARRLTLVSKVFPPAKNLKKWNQETLTLEAAKYANREEFYKGSPGAHSVSIKLGLINSIGLPPRMQGISKAEIEILHFLKAMNADFKTKRFGNDYELDCYSESLKLGIEYNGLYWHAQKPRSYHFKKTKYFENLGIRVIHIWEHEWRDRRKQVENYLTSACKHNATRVGARKCEFKEITPDTARAFLEERHIQGAPQSVVLALGCFYKDELVAVATFGLHHRKGFKGPKVLNRFACNSGVTVSGSLAKMTSMAYDKLGPLRSWADYSKSQASGYIAAGWKVDRLIPIDYFYADTQARVISKQSRRKSAVGTPSEVTEFEHAQQDGLYRIWDCGKIALVYNKL